MINQIKEILECFDFETVKNLMGMKIWPDYDDKGNICGTHVWILKNCGVPTVADLKLLAIQLLMDIVVDPNEEQIIHAGPFKVVKHNGHLSLEFVTIRWEVE